MQINNDQYNIIEWAKHLFDNLLVITAPLVIGVYKISEYFIKKAEIQNKKDREFITDVAREVSKEVVKEVLDSILPDIHSNIQEIKKEVHETNRRIDSILNKK